ncbi:23S RNA-specific pseudouridylate synthase [Flavobacterium saliperosum S13]|uniref:tRNA pseudouridine32 synthase / 23S rRNA pseudouridine746 synthase n=2 Tax=Flavobacterium saliperosum TaxID=329186 RepID=A0A1G4VET3_9FLAO|nr:RluA family pseudouridine synthase [Flavobacterium saliperosum]ESU25794.1 23S RNA-specific pseudouridylate synthase [Flavobacterium saliperosum S13]SCX05637.1 tRNA pseudouridine32 synthase / 23S rRNA pseudouridine746 synthase [Flavobacterium saliperosum]
MNSSETSTTTCFIPFKEAIDSYALPERFTFPFYYEPHPLSVLAAKELQEYLEQQTDWEHNFGLDDNQEGLVIGKMFGVMVVRNEQNEIGYLAAFSGKLAEKNIHPLFVPPIFDMLEEDSFFIIGIKELTQINNTIEALENNPEFLELSRLLKTETESATKKLEEQKLKMSEAKKVRKLLRKKAQEEITDAVALEIEMNNLVRESLKDKFLLRELTEYLEERISVIHQKLNRFTTEISALKEERKLKSADLQQLLFDQYHFLNNKGEAKSLCDIFEATALLKPPAAAGECAAPKLLQYAYLNNLQPIAMAEFWWGESPKSEIRKHGQFYPACRGKCEPILGHMLEGLSVDENPLLVNPALGVEIETIYEDDCLAIINKPAEFLSVPGINIMDSVYERMKLKYPLATGPLIVHRLDMATSGLMLIAKDKDTHKLLQSQFIKRTVKKRYVALLDGIVTDAEGEIDLPLRIDLEDRPRQLVCYEYGKRAVTKFKVIERTEKQTRIHFWPITGRTHQLRMHASHFSGLNAPIVGDDLYGTKANRLHLHAEWLEFKHPVTKETMTFEVAAEF